MEIRKILKENWFTQRPDERAGLVTVLYGFVLFGFFLLQITNTFEAGQWMPASRHFVFERHEYWRLWTSLFAHGDMGHILSNAIVLLPFSFWLSSYFGVFRWVVSSVLIGGLINALVLLTMPEKVNLIGISGVVYWVGAAYTTLFLLIDRRKSTKQRWSVAIFISLMLFAPETYHQDVSYLSHLVGFVFGVVSGLIYYFSHRKKIQKAEVYDYTFDYDFEEEMQYGDTTGGLQ